MRLIPSRLPNSSIPFLLILFIFFAVGEQFFAKEKEMINKNENNGNAEINVYCGKKWKKLRAPLKKPFGSLPRAFLKRKISNSLMKYAKEKSFTTFSLFFSFSCFFLSSASFVFFFFFFYNSIIYNSDKRCNNFLCELGAQNRIATNNSRSLGHTQNYLRTMHLHRVPKVLVPFQRPRDWLLRGDNVITPFADSQLWIGCTYNISSGTFTRRTKRIIDAWIKKC